MKRRCIPWLVRCLLISLITPLMVVSAPTRFDAPTTATAALYQRWKVEANPETKTRLREELYGLAVRSRDYFVMNEISQDIYTSNTQTLENLVQRWEETSDPTARAALVKPIEKAADTVGGWAELDKVHYGEWRARSEAKLPPEATTVTLRELCAFKEVPTGKDDHPPAYKWTTRRINGELIEVWCPAHGWLIGKGGKILHEARVPRRDGHGRQWFGAFLPDGHWVTTDLWEDDCQLHFFAPDGRFIRSIETASLKSLPQLRQTFGNSPIRIDWARSDREGKGFILTLSEGNYSTTPFYISATGESRILKEVDLWAQAWPRALGSRFHSVNYSDDLTLHLGRFEAGHGKGVGYPTYVLRPADKTSAGWDAQPKPDQLFNFRLYEGTANMGFWPRTKSVYIGRDKRMTWFFNEKGEPQRWIAAERFADARDGRAMLFEDARGRVIVMGPDFRIQEVRRYVLDGGKGVAVQNLFDDLGLGLFEVLEPTGGARLILGRYE